MCNRKSAKFKPENMPNFAFPPTFSPVNISRYTVFVKMNYITTREQRISLCLNAVSISLSFKKKDKSGTTDPNLM